MTITQFRDDVVAFIASEFSGVDVAGSWDLRLALSGLQEGQPSIVVVPHRNTPRNASRSRGTRGSVAPARKTNQYELQVGLRVKVSDRSTGPDQYSDLMEEIAHRLSGQLLGNMLIDSVTSDPIYNADELKDSAVFISVLLVTALGGE